MSATVISGKDGAQTVLENGMAGKSMDFGSHPLLLSSRTGDHGSEYVCSVLRLAPTLRLAGEAFVWWFCIRLMPPIGFFVSSGGLFGRRQVGLSAVLGIAVGAASLDVATRLWLCPSAQFSVSSATLLVPGLWAVWFPLGLLLVPWLVVVSFGVLGCLCPGCGQGFGLALLCPECGLHFIWLIFLFNQVGFEFCCGEI